MSFFSKLFSNPTQQPGDRKAPNDDPSKQAPESSKADSSAKKAARSHDKTPKVVTGLPEEFTNRKLSQLWDQYALDGKVRIVIARRRCSPAACMRAGVVAAPILGGVSRGHAVVRSA